MSIALTEEKIKEALVNLPDWTFTNDKIKREYIFRNFVEAVGFIVEIAFEGPMIRLEANGEGGGI